MRAEELRRIHEASLRVLGTTGVVFDSGDVCQRFRDSGFATEGRCVFMTEDQAAAAVHAPPRSFELVARDSGRSLVFGRGRTGVASTSGPTFLAEGGELRLPEMADAIKCAKLCHQLENVDMAGYAP